MFTDSPSKGSFVTVKVDGTEVMSLPPPSSLPRDLCIQSLQLKGWVRPYGTIHKLCWSVHIV